MKYVISWTPQWEWRNQENLFTWNYILQKSSFQKECFLICFKIVKLKANITLCIYHMFQKFFSLYYLFSRIGGPSAERRSFSYFSIPNFLKSKFLICPLLFLALLQKTCLKSKKCASDNPDTIKTTVNRESCTAFLFNFETIFRRKFR